MPVSIRRMPSVRDRSVPDERLPVRGRLLIAGSRQKSAVEAQELLDLQRLAGNEAVTELIFQHSVGPASAAVLQRAPEEKEGEGGPVAAAETGVGAIGQYNDAKTVYKKGGDTLVDFIKGEAKEVDELGALSDAKLLSKGAEVGVLAPLGMFFGGMNIAEGIKAGDPSRVVSGGVDVLGGAATIGAMAAPALAPIAPAATAFNVAKGITEMGMEESPYDLPGTSASWGESAREATGSRFVGGVVTVGSTLVTGPVAFAYGVKHMARKLLEPVDMKEVMAIAHPEAANIDLKSTEEPIGAETHVVHETLPPGPDRWAAAGGHMTKAQLRKTKRALQTFLTRLAAAEIPAKR